MRAPVFDTGLSSLQRMQIVLVSNALSAIYLHHVVRKLQPGLPRLLAGLPVIILFQILPTMFNMIDEILPRCSVLFTASWMGSFKASNPASPLACCMAVHGHCMATPMWHVLTPPLWQSSLFILTCTKGSSASSASPCPM